MRHLVLLYFLSFPMFTFGQSSSDYWNWLETIHTKNQDLAETYFRFCSTGDFDRNLKYGTPGFYLNRNNLGIVIGKQLDSHLLGNATGNTINLFVTRDNISIIDNMVSELVDNYFKAGDSYITLKENGTTISSGRYDSDMNRNGLQIELRELVSAVDLSIDNSELQMMLFNANDALNHPAVGIKISQEGYYGYNWLLQVSGSDSQIDKLLTKMPHSINYLNCDLDGTHAYLSIQLGSSTNIEIRGLFDTGASLITIPQNIANQLLRSNEAELIGKQQFSTANGVITSDILIIDAIFCQGVLFSNVKASVGVTNDILIGQSLFSGLEWGYDNSSGRVILK